MSYGDPGEPVGPVNRLQVFPTLSVTPAMLTGFPFQTGKIDTKTTSVEAPVESTPAVVCVVSADPLRYPRLLTTVGACAKAGAAPNRARRRITTRRRTELRNG